MKGFKRAVSRPQESRALVTNLQGELVFSECIPSVDSVGRLRLCLLLASLACVLRPTNLLIWVCIASYTVIRNQCLSILEGNLLMDVVIFPKSGKVLLREAILCG